MDAGEIVILRGSCIVEVRSLFIHAFVIVGISSCVERVCNALARVIFDGWSSPTGVVIDGEMSAALAICTFCMEAVGFCLNGCCNILTGCESTHQGRHLIILLLKNIIIIFKLF